MSSKATPKAAAAPKKAAAPAPAPAATPKPAGKTAAAPAATPKPAGKAAPAATPKPQGKEAPKQAAAAAAPAKAAGAKKEVSTGNNAVIVYGYHFAGKAYSEIRASFEEHFGPLVQFRIKRSPRTKKGPYAIAFFDSAASAKKALDVNGKNFDGSVVKVEVANKAKLVPEPSSRFSTLWISPVNRAVPHQAIYDYVKSANSKPLRVRRYKAGYARVYFDTVEHAQAAAKGATGPVRAGDKPAVIRFSSRTKTHDKKKFVEPLKLATKQRGAAAAAKVSPKAAAKPAGKEAKAAPKAAAPTPKAAPAPAEAKGKPEKSEKAAPSSKAAAEKATPKAAESKPAAPTPSSKAAAKSAAPAASKPAAPAAPTPSSKAAGGKKGGK